MCLVAEERSRKVADKDIHVWKLVRFGQDHDHWHGPIYSMNGLFDTVVTSDPLDETEYDHCFDFYYFKYIVSITSGFIHAHLTREHAEKQRDNLIREDSSSCNLYKRCFVCEATIPKGSVYYVDIDGEEIATSKIIVHKPKELE